MGQATSGTTGSNLDRIVDMILADPGLIRSIRSEDIQGGADAADALNYLILEAVTDGNLMADGVIDLDDVYAINSFIRDPQHPGRHTDFVALHGDDESGSETGFHLVQNDGGVATLEGRNLINTVFDGIFHIGFEIVGDRVRNEDGDANASVGQLAHWLTYFLTGGKSCYFGGMGDDTVEGRELNDNLQLGAGNDYGYGGFGRDSLFGGAGNDTLSGGSGNDKLSGQAGNDRMHGDDGKDKLSGGGGDDTLYGSYDNDVLRGEDGADVLRGDDGRDRLDGGTGDDDLDGGDGNDRVWGMDGNDRLNGDGGDDGLFGDDGDDTIYGGSGNDNLSGGAGADYLHGGYDDDTLSGGDGIDRLFGSYGNDRLLGGAQDDELYGEDGNDRLSGQGGNDEQYGGFGNDRLNGDGGDDRLYGEYGNDLLDGGTGDDYLDGGAGNNTIIGGLGDDHFRGNIGADDFLFARTAFGNDEMNGFNGADGDRIVLDEGIAHAISINTVGGVARTVLTLVDAGTAEILGTVTLSNSLLASIDIVVDPLAFG